MYNGQHTQTVTTTGADLRGINQYGYPIPKPRYVFK